MKIGVLIQARINSSRLPGKVLYPMKGKTLIQNLMRSARKIEADIYCLCVPYGEGKLFKIFADIEEFQVIEGPENDVAKRLLNAIEDFNLEVVVHITGDKVYFLPLETKILLNYYLKHSCDLVTYEESPFKERTGAIFNPNFLKSKYNIGIRGAYELEHVKPIFTENKECKHCIIPIPEYVKNKNYLTYTLDTIDDYLTILKQLKEIDDWELK